VFEYKGDVSRDLKKGQKWVDNSQAKKFNKAKNQQKI
jgi:hypothetical protein